jgi:hypothetical protein
MDDRVGMYCPRYGHQGAEHDFGIQPDIGLRHGGSGGEPTSSGPTPTHHPVSVSPAGQVLGR